MNIKHIKSILIPGIAAFCTSEALARYTCPVYPRPQMYAMRGAMTNVTSAEVLLRGENKGGMWDRFPADKKEAYALEITPGKLTVYANSETGVFYAKQTVSQLLEGVPHARNAHRDPFPNDDIAGVAAKGQLPCGKLIDWPDLPYRGTVEGYYGTPWSFQARVSQFDFYARNKMNTYIYAPKDDPYHHGRGCYIPYPEEKAAEIRKLVEYARRNHLHFVWAIHPANTVDWQKNGGKDDLDGLCNKLEQMYGLGVRDFGVLVDDSGGEIGRPERQVELCNYILENFIRKHKDVNQTLVMCPTGYNRSWTNANFLNTLGNGLDKSIPVMWTGDTVVHDITREGQKWVNDMVQRPTFIWWNWPCSDYKRSRLSMGRTYGLDIAPVMKNLMSGFVANPMEQAEASKIGLYGVANYTWNIEGFRSKETWKQAISRLYPENKDAMFVFCKHNSYLLPNYHAYDREESVEIAGSAQAFVKSLEEATPNYEAAQDMLDEYANMEQAAEKLLAAPELEDLRAEIKPWLIQFRHTGHAGTSIIAAMESRDPEEKQDLFFEALDSINAMKGTERPEWTAGVVKPVADVEVAMKQMTPALLAAFDYENTRLYADLSGIPAAIPTYTASAPISEKDARKLSDKKTNTFWSADDRQKAGDMICMDFGVPKNIRSISLVMGGPRPHDYPELGVFEISDDGEHWQTVGEPAGGPNVLVELKDKPVRARMLRYRITKPRRQWWCVCGFSVNTSADPFVATNMEPRPRFTVYETAEALGVNRVMEYTKLMPGEFIDLEIPSPIHANKLELNLENPDIEQWGRLELTMNDGTVHTMPCKAVKNRICIEDDLPKGLIKSMRITNAATQAQEIKVTIFRLNRTPGEENTNPGALLDTDLSTFYNCGARPLEMEVAVPEGCTELIIIGNAKCNVSGATPAAPTAHTQTFKLSGKASKVTVTAPQQPGKRVNEIILK